MHQIELGLEHRLESPNRLFPTEQIQQMHIAGTRIRQPLVECVEHEGMRIHLRQFCQRICGNLRSVLKSVIAFDDLGHVTLGADCIRRTTLKHGLRNRRILTMRLGDATFEYALEPIIHF